MDPTWINELHVSLATTLAAGAAMVHVFLRTISWDLPISLSVYKKSIGISEKEKESITTQIHWINPPTYSIICKIVGQPSCEGIDQVSYNICVYIPYIFSA